MEKIDSKIMDEVLEKYDKYDFDSYTDADVLRVLNKNEIDEEDFAVLLSPAALKHLEEIARKAKHETRRQFGTSVSLYTPLYIANYCVNHCVYCGFNCKNDISRAKLTMEEIETEFQAIAETGLKEILLLTGESNYHSPVEYIGEAVSLAKKYFSTIGVEIQPLDVSGYKHLHECGADFVSVYQETYNTEKYKEVHLSGPKKFFDYRFNSQERALLGGMRGVGFGALLGLDNYRKDAFATGLHGKYVQKKYPHAEISFSVPRIRPCINNYDNNPKDVHEPQLLQILCAYRLFMPFAVICISTRERAGFRDNVLGIAATKISAGVKTTVGGHDEEEKGDAQFIISDPRSVSEIKQSLEKRGFQPVFTDYIRV